MKRLFFLITFACVGYLCFGSLIKGYTPTYSIPEDLRLEANFILGDDPTAEEQARLKQYFDSAFAANKYANVNSVCQEYNRDVTPHHLGHYCIVYTDAAGEEISFICEKSSDSAVDKIPVVSQIWHTLKFFFFFLLAIALPVTASMLNWPRWIRILLYVIFAIPILITGFCFILAALASVWAFLCIALMLIVGGVAVFAAFGAFISSSNISTAQSRVDNYARTHGGMYEHGSRESSIEHELEKMKKKK